MKTIKHITDWLKEVQYNCKINKLLRSKDIRWTMFYPDSYGIIHPNKSQKVLSTTNSSDVGYLYHCLHAKKLLENVYELDLDHASYDASLTMSGYKVYLVYSDEYYFVSAFLVNNPNFWSNNKNYEYLISQIQQAKELYVLKEGMKQRPQEILW